MHKQERHQYVVCNRSNKHRDGGAQPLPMLPAPSIQGNSNQDDLSLEQMGYVEKATKAPKFSDASEQPSSDNHKAKCGLLLSLCELAINFENRVGFVYDGQTIPFVIALLHRTTNDAYAALMLKFLAQVMVTSYGDDGMHLMYNLGGHILFATKGVRNVQPIINLVSGGFMGDNMVRFHSLPYHMCEGSMNGLSHYLQIDVIRKEIIEKTDIKDRFSKTLQTKNPTINQLIVAARDLVLKDVKPILNEQHVLYQQYMLPLQQESVVQKCSQCGAMGTADKPLTNCAGCSFHQYCSRECQLKEWKRGHSSECKKLAQEK